MRGPREGLREDPALGGGGRGKGATPLADGWPPGPGPPSRPPPPPLFGRQGASPGDRRTPPTPPPPPSHTGPRASGAAPPPPQHPPQLGSHRRGPPPPQGRGGAPTHRRNGDTVRATAARPAPTNPHRRAGATRTTEHEGGRAPRDHSPLRGDRGGVCRSAGAPRGAVHGPPLTPPRPGAALQPRPHARAGGEGQKGVPQAAARNESGEAAARHPPRGKGDGPPPPERGAGV